MTHHAVCRDCPLEAVCTTEEAANSWARTHAENTGHETDAGRIE